MLLSLLLAPIGEGLLTVKTGMALGRSLSSRTGRENPPPLIELPQGEIARRAWLKKFGSKWGLDEDSEARVICTCTCCGDRCRMGAACCCAAEKFPLDKSSPLQIRDPRCLGTSPEAPYTPVFLSWVYQHTQQNVFVESASRAGNFPFQRRPETLADKPPVPPPQS